MTDRAKGLLVHLDGDYRDDDAEVVAQAIRMVKGVAHVEPIPADYHDKLNRDRIRRELADRLFDALGVGWTKTGGP